MGQYLVSQAQQIKSHLRIPIGLIQSSMSIEEIAHALEVQHYQEILQTVVSWDGDRLGKVIDDAENIFRPCKLNLVTNIGRDILRRLAMTAMIYSIAALVFDEVQKAKSEAAKPGLETVDDRTRFLRIFEEGKRFTSHCQRDIGGHWFFESISNLEPRIVIGCQFSLPAREITNKIELLKGKMASWAFAERGLTIVLEVFEATNRPVKGTVLFTHTCGPISLVQDMVDQAAENLRRDLGRAGP